MRRIAYALFILAGLIVVVAFALWTIAIGMGVPALGWIGVLAIILAMLMSFIGSGLVHTAQQREQQR